jgi:hypothetical protein
MQTTQLVAVRSDIVGDPYSDLDSVIKKYALLQATTTPDAETYDWKVIDWSTVELSPAILAASPGLSYFKALVEQTPKPGSRTAKLVGQPVGRIYVPMSRSLVDDLHPGFDLSQYINDTAKVAAAAAWEERNPKAKSYRVTDWTGPFDYMYEHGDLPPQACCFQAYVEVTR